MFSFMLYAIVPALLRYAIHTPCFSAFWYSHPYIFMHFLEMFFILTRTSTKANGHNCIHDLV